MELACAQLNYIYIYICSKLCGCRCMILSLLCCQEYMMHIVYCEGLSILVVNCHCWCHRWSEKQSCICKDNFQETAHYTAWWAVKSSCKSLLFLVPVLIFFMSTYRGNYLDTASSMIFVTANLHMVGNIKSFRL